jgi:hypothetical protein
MQGQGFKQSCTPSICTSWGINMRFICCLRIAAILSSFCLLTGDYSQVNAGTREGSSIEPNMFFMPTEMKLSGVHGPILAMTMFQDKLIVGGFFDSAGGVAVKNIAAWDGYGWIPLGLGVDSIVRALTVYNNRLVVGGGFLNAGGNSASHIATWDGSSWNSFGAGPSGGWGGIRALAVFDGSLIVGGGFDHFGGVAANNIVAWNESVWSPLGLGTDALVSSIAVFNSKLIAGGTFDSAGGVTANRIASWDGSSWQALGTGLSHTTDPLFLNVRTMIVYAGRLIVGGFFNLAGGIAANYIASWNGANWSPLATGMSGFGTGLSYGITTVNSLAIYDNRLIAGGTFSNAGGVTANCIAAWNGVSWSSLGTGICCSGNPEVDALAVQDTILFAGGEFWQAGDVYEQNLSIAEWNGSTWSALGPPPATGVGFEITTGSSSGGIRVNISGAIDSTIPVGCPYEPCNPLCYVGCMFPFDTTCTARGKIPGWANELVAIVNEGPEQLVLPCMYSFLIAKKWTGNSWKLTKPDTWVRLKLVYNPPNKDDLASFQIPLVIDTDKNATDTIYCVIDLDQWHDNPQPLQNEYSIVNGACVNLPGMLFGTTPIIFDSLAGESENPFSTSPYAGQVTLIGKSNLVPQYYECGDANGDTHTNVGDAVYLINYIFKNGSSPNPNDAGDANADSKVNVGDAVYMINYIFKAGPAPHCP